VVARVGTQGILNAHGEPLGDVELVLLDEVGPQARTAVVDGGGPSYENHLRHLEQIAHVADAVAVDVALVGVGIDGAVVARVAQAVTVEVELSGVRRLRAVVAEIAHAVLIGVGLVRIGNHGTVVADVAEPVAVVVHDAPLTHPRHARISRRARIAIRARCAVGCLDVRRAGVARPVAALRDVTRVDGGTADVCLLGIRWAGRAASGTGLLGVADARRSTADGAGEQEGIVRTECARTGAVLGEIAPTAAGRQTVLADRNPSAGQLALEPSQASAVSQGPATAPQTKPFCCTPSAGQLGPFPGQASATSQPPASGRQTVLVERKSSAGHAPLDPSQVSATSQMSLAARHCVPAAFRVQTAVQQEPDVPFAKPSSHCSPHATSTVPSPH